MIALEVLRGVSRRIMALAELPQTLDRLSHALQSLDRLAELDDTLRILGTFEQSLAGIAAISESVERLAATTESLPELTRFAAALPELARSAEALPKLTEHAAALPELGERVEMVELRVVTILSHLERLRPTVDALTVAAADLHRAVGPIGRIAGRLPGSRPRVGEAPAPALPTEQTPI